MASRVNKVKMLIAALAFAGIPLLTTASCNPYSRTLTVLRDDDHYRHDGWGILDWFIEDDYYDSGCWYDCYEDEYWVEEVVYYPW